MPDDSHKRRTLRGIAWNFLRVIGQTGLSLGVGIALARMLPPADFGLLAIAMVFISLAELVASLGMGPAIIQLKTLSNRHLQVATTLSLVMGTLLVLLFWGIAIPVAEIFHDPRVADVLKLLSIGLWFSALSAVSRGMLMRQLDFRRLFKVDISAYLVGHAVVSVSLAAMGFGVWSLVLGTVVALTLSAIFLLFMSPPRLPLSLARKEISELFSFGGGVSLNNAINYLAANVDYLVIGKSLDATLLGLYSRAYQLVTLPLSKIASTLSSVMFPAYAEIQADQEKLRRAYLMAVNVTALVTYPILAGMAVAADTVITGLYGEPWRQAGNALTVLCLAGMFKAVFHLAGAIAQATGNIYSEVKRQSVYLLTLTIGCISMVNYGIVAVAWAVVAGSLWLYLSMAHLACEIVGASYGEFLKSQWPGVVMSIAIISAELLALAFLPTSWAAPWRLAALMMVASLTFMVSFFLLPRRVLGEMPAWLVLNHAHHFPESIRIRLSRHFSRE